MPDIIAETLATYGRIARARLAAALQPLDPQADMAAVESFLMRTGRPLPTVVVLGGNLALRCMQVDRAGGRAVGVDGVETVIELARRLYPQGEFLVGDARALPVDTNAFDGAWTESVFSHVPRKDVSTAMASVHGALRPGGLLYVRLPLGDDEGFEDTPDGPIYRVRWDARQFEQTLAALDFSLLEMRDLPGPEAALVFRREY
ncbi:MAG: class I SAM-dependent methyltransferase [Planctomycetes bacterium]|nr:class I SAM-dependent methyltransferase [Planctomycetota bacterium]MCW8137150.1 class I SAM-dependent methyltransferase [Planctomycetota bacterium]